MAANDVLWQAMELDRDGPHVDQAGGYSVGVPRDPTTHETRHLVVVVPAELKMLDLSLDRLSRPDKGIPLQATWFEIAHEWWNGSYVSMSFKAANGVHLLYEHRAWPAFETSVDWLNPKTAAPLSEQPWLR
jgi:hypothetical protein